MKFLFTITLLITIGSFYSAAGELDSLSKSVQFLVKRIQSKHVKPRAIDEAYGNQVHDYLISFIDSDNEILRVDDLTYLKGLSSKIPDNIKNGNQFYFNEFQRLVNLRSKEISVFQERFLSTPINLNSTKQFDFNQQQKITESTYKTFWEASLSYSILSEMVAMHPKDSKLLLKDSLVQFEKKARLKIQNRTTNYLESIQNAERLKELYLLAIAMSFDPHSSYFSPSQKKGFFEELSVQKEKFGISYGLDEENRIILTDVLPGSSAWLSNELFTGDFILGIKFGLKNSSWLEIKNGVSGLKELSEAFEKFDGREISIRIKDENGDEIQVDLEKGVVYNDNDNIKNALMLGSQKIGYISLPDFYTNYSADMTEQGCANDMAKCILKLKKDGIQGLILDLRGNGGGSLYEAISLSGIFVDYGPILATQDNLGVVKVLKDINRGFIYDGPLLVLIDEGSASASEIVAAVLQDYQKAIIVGVPSFGKATSQQVWPLDPVVGEIGGIQENPNFGYVSITEGVLYRVNGQSNQVVGVKPDIEVGMTAFDSTQHRERNYKNALIPPPIEKKISFVASSNPLPVAELVAFSVKQRATGIYDSYYKTLDTISSNYNQSKATKLDLASFWNESQKNNQLRTRFKSLSVEPKWPYTVSSNSFDQMVYDKNPILKMYFEDFTKHLNSDIELFEAVGIMDEWLQTINK